MLKQITLVQNRNTDPQSQYSQQILDFFSQRGIKVFHIQVSGKECPEIPEEASQPDLVIVVGGDGTFLHAARQFVAKQIPLVGVNTGALGFLAHIEAQRLTFYLDLLMNNSYELESRTMLSIQDSALKTALKSKGSASGLHCISTADGSIQDEIWALNDVVIKNANPSHLCRLHLFVNNIPAAVYDADGLILSTPSGTTAYTMAAGGPVISPEVDAISLTPICPHSFSAKAVVVPCNKEFRIQSDPKNQEVVYALDGLECGVLQSGESLVVTRAPVTFKMIKFEPEEENDFYVLLKRKLQWSLNPRGG